MVDRGINLSDMHLNYMQPCIIDALLTEVDYFEMLVISMILIAIGLIEGDL